MTGPKRACPICKRCGNKKFTVLSKNKGFLILECNKCYSKIELVDKDIGTLIVLTLENDKNSVRDIKSGLHW